MHDALPNFACKVLTCLKWACTRALIHRRQLLMNAAQVKWTVAPDGRLAHAPTYLGAHYRMHTPL
jgi:hypothetical protein